MIKKIFVFLMAFASFGCVEIEPDRAEIMQKRAVVKKAVPVEINLEPLDAQKKNLEALFTNTYVSPKYVLKKNPFVSVVEEYRLALDEDDSLSPILKYPFKEFKLVGVLTGEVGNIAVLSLGEESFYLRTGDSFSTSKSTIVLIGQDFIKVRDTSKDIFGKTVTEVKDVKLEQVVELSKEKS